MEYTIRIKKDKKSGWLTGQCEQIPEAISQGKDLEELMFMMEDAIKLVLTSVPRHSDIVETTAYDICKQLGIPKPKIN